MMMAIYVFAFASGAAMIAQRVAERRLRPARPSINQRALTPNFVSREDHIGFMGSPNAPA